MISISLLIEFLLATVISSIMYVAITWTNGNFIKNVLIYSVLNIIILIILGLRGILGILLIWIIYIIEGIPMVWIMNKLYDNVDAKVFIITSAICWFIFEFMLSFLNG